jgi:hypothetical protein
MLEHIPIQQVPTVLSNILHATEQVFFQISTEPDILGALINQPLHVTVRPASWWGTQIQKAGGRVIWLQVNMQDVQMLVTSS